MISTTRLAAFAIAWTLAPAFAAAAPRTWRLVREAPAAPGTEVVAFADDSTAVATGCTAPVFRTMDGGKSWSPRLLREGCHYGLEAVPGLTVITGGSSLPGEVATCASCWAKWADRGAVFGGPFPRHARHLSFLDDKRGALGTDEELALTSDGGRTVVPKLAPEDAAVLAAVSLSEERGRTVLRLLDENGTIWRSDDGGATWARAPSPLEGRVLPSTRGPTAALRFIGEMGVLAVNLDGRDTAGGHVYRTHDGGGTWAEESLSAPFGAAVLTLSADARILVALDVGSGTLKVYRAE